jgi:CRP-like cAMP-binding protein
MTKLLSGYAKWRTEKTSRTIRLRFKIHLVEKVPLFAGLSQKEYSLIARSVHEVEFPEGTRLVTAGEPGGELFVIIEGNAVVTTRLGRTALLKAGDFFGEMSLIDDAPRSATVDATTPIRLLVLKKQDFWSVLDGQMSIVRKVMQALSQRLRNAEQASRDLRDGPVRV